MKKLLAILLAALFLMSLAACGDDSDKSDSSSDETTAAVTATDKSDATQAKDDDATEKADDPDVNAKTSKKDADKDDSGKNDSGSSKKYATLKEYYNDPVNTQGLDQIKSSGQGITDIDVRVEGSTVVYDFTYLSAIDESMISSVKESLDQVLDSSAGTFDSLATTMQDDIEEDISLTVYYRNADGTVITQRTYKP